MRHGAPEDTGRRSATQAIALVRPAMVVVAQKAAERMLQRHRGAEEALAEHDPANAREEWSLQALAGQEILIQPNSPSRGVVVAFVLCNGAPVEFLQSLK